MKAIIKIVTAGKFTPDQEQIIKRIAIVLAEHNLSVSIETTIKKKVTQTLKIKRA
jgi:hypothetical protein